VYSVLLSYEHTDKPASQSSIYYDQPESAHALGPWLVGMWKRTYGNLQVIEELWKNLEPKAVDLVGLSELQRRKQLMARHRSVLLCRSEESDSFTLS